MADLKESQSQGRAGSGHCDLAHIRDLVQRMSLQALLPLVFKDGGVIVSTGSKYASESKRYNSALSPTYSDFARNLPTDEIRGRFWHHHCEARRAFAAKRQNGPLEPPQQKPFGRDHLLFHMELERILRHAVQPEEVLGPLEHEKMLQEQPQSLAKPRRDVEDLILLDYFLSWSDRIPTTEITIHYMRPDFCDFDTAYNALHSEPGPFSFEETPRPIKHHLHREPYVPG